MENTSMEKFVQNLIQSTADLSTLTQKIVRQKYTEHIGVEHIDAEERSRLKEFVHELIQEFLHSSPRVSQESENVGNSDLESSGSGSGVDYFEDDKSKEVGQVSDQDFEGQGSDAEPVLPNLLPEEEDVIMEVGQQSDLLDLEGQGSDTQHDLVNLLPEETDIRPGQKTVNLKRKLMSSQSDNGDTTSDGQASRKPRKKIKLASSTTQDGRVNLVEADFTHTRSSDHKLLSRVAKQQSPSKKNRSRKGVSVEDVRKSMLEDGDNNTLGDGMSPSSESGSNSKDSGSEIEKWKRKPKKQWRYLLSDSDVECTDPIQPHPKHDEFSSAAESSDFTKTVPAKKTPEKLYRKNSEEKTSWRMYGGARKRSVWTPNSKRRQDVSSDSDGLGGLMVTPPLWRKQRNKTVVYIDSDAADITSDKGEGDRDLPGPDRTEESIKTLKDSDSLDSDDEPLHKKKTQRKFDRKSKSELKAKSKKSKNIKDLDTMNSDGENTAVCEKTKVVKKQKKSKSGGPSRSGKEGDHSEDSDSSVSDDHTKPKKRGRKFAGKSQSGLKAKTKKSNTLKDPDTTDTSINEDSDGGNTASREKTTVVKNRKRSKSGGSSRSGKEGVDSEDSDSLDSDDEPLHKKTQQKAHGKSKSELKAKSKKSKSIKNENQDPTKTSHVVLLEKMVRHCGLMPCGKNYSKTFGECDSAKKRVLKLKQILADAGLEGKATWKSIENLKLKRETAELDTSNILKEGGRGRRNVESMYSRHQPIAKSPVVRTPTTPIRETFKRLKGIIDSEESDG